MQNRLTIKLLYQALSFSTVANPRHDRVRADRRKDGLRAYGAGILNSPGELQCAVERPEPQRLPLDIERVMRTRYKIDSYQQTYFVIESFQELSDKTAPDFTPIYERVKAMGELEAGAL